MPRYRYTGSFLTFCKVGDEVVQVAPGQIVSSSTAPSPEFECLVPVKKVTPHPPVVKKTPAPKKAVKKTKEVKYASTTQTSGVG